MIELPEAVTLASQLNNTIAGMTISEVVSGRSPHKFAWYYGNPELYSKNMKNSVIRSSQAWGGFVQITTDAGRLLFSEGVQLRYSESAIEEPAKHQLLVRFSSGSFLSASVRMYGGVGFAADDEPENEYYITAKKKPSPISPEFNDRYFGSLISGIEKKSCSLKEFLATEQRIPGLGNGVLQDILFNAGLHPKLKLQNMSEGQITTLQKSVISTLMEMIEGGGRDTEKDLFNNPGGYHTKMCRFTAGKPCGVCGSPIRKASYMGGSIYFCGECQKIR